MCILGAGLASSSSAVHELSASSPVLRRDPDQGHLPRRGRRPSFFIFDLRGGLVEIGCMPYPSRSTTRSLMKSSVSRLSSRASLQAGYDLTVQQTQNLPLQDG
jgi:hypothetical protein